MQKKWLIKSLVVFVLLVGFQPLTSASASTGKVYWDGLLMVKGQIGKVKVLKPINLWKRDGDNLVFERVLNQGEQYRVYRYDQMHGGQYGVGGGYYITKMDGFVEYKTPSKRKLAELEAIYAPSPEVTDLSIGKVTKEETTELAPGVTQKIMSVDSNRGKQKIYSVEYDGKAENISIETTLANDQLFGFESVQNQANREDSVIAGVNGDYFNKDGFPVDLMMQDGNIVTTSQTPLDELAVFGVKKDGKPIIGNPKVDLSVTVNGQATYTIDSVNRKRLANHLVLYTPKLASSTRSNQLGTEVVVTVESGKLNGHSVLTGTVKKVIKSVGNEALNEGEIVLSGHNLASQFLEKMEVGDQIQINTSFHSDQWNEVVEVISGRYHLVRNGSLVPQNVAGAHPRSAVGISENGGVILVVADGRKPTTSVGLTLNEMATVMKDLGAVDAFTFDGGGSSTLVTKEPGESQATVVNSPSDGKPRNVSNALLILKRFIGEDINPNDDETITNPDEPTIIADFEGDIQLYTVDGARYNHINLEQTQTAKLGEKAAKLSYDFTGTTGTSGVYLKAKTPIKVTGYPEKIGMWVYGDNGGHWLRMQLKDSTNKMVQLDFTKNVNWTGWKYVEATVPADLKAPLYIDVPVRYMAIDDANKNSGYILVDHIQATY